jgi:hypothetical protein
MIFPRPVSARQVLRRNLAKTIKSTSSLYSQIVEDIADQTSHPDHSVDAQERLDRYRSHFLKLLVSDEPLGDCNHLLTEL